MFEPKSLPQHFFLLLPNTSVSLPCHMQTEESKAKGYPVTSHVLPSFNKDSYLIYPLPVFIIILLCNSAAEMEKPLWAVVFIPLSICLCRNQVQNVCGHWAESPRWRISSPPRRMGPSGALVRPCRLLCGATGAHRACPSTRTARQLPPPHPKGGTAHCGPRR